MLTDTQILATGNVDIRTFEYNPTEFSLDHTVASGQCFRWKRRGDGWWV
ncbi:MAG: DNA glycosylase, partial [Chloroflexia bacterium]